jgi:hypothetical protein
MSEHLTADEIILAVSKSPQSLASNRYDHFTGCAKCQNEYISQNTTNTVLSGLKPKSAPAGIVKSVLSQLGQIVPARVKEKTDWTFLIAIVLLFSIGSWFLFSGKAETYLKQYAPNTVTEKQIVKDFTIIDSIREFFSDLNIKMPNLNFGNFYLALGVLAVLFYMIIDKKIARNLKAHKT